MKKTINFLHKTSINLLLYSLILIVILVILHFALKLFYLKFRQWVYLAVIGFSIISILIYLMQKFIRINEKTKLIIGCIFAILVTICIIFWKIVLFMLFLLLTIINPKSEHIVERQGIKYVATVESNLLDTTVYFHKYVNFLVMGSEVEFNEHYKGSYNSIVKEKEENDINSIEEIDIDEQTKTETINPEYILYEKEIRTGTIIRIVYEDSVLGGRMLINVQKTTDGGKTWNNQLKNSDECIMTNNEAKFIFINENVGFINNSSLFILGEENNSLLVTVDGGESFKSVNFIFPSDIKDTNFYISDLPYLENEKLKVKLFSPDTTGSEEGNYYEFLSVDNGLNWTFSK